jgi:predicted amidophosphoribosyltransferase
MSLLYISIQRLRIGLKHIYVLFHTLYVATSDLVNGFLSALFPKKVKVPRVRAGMLNANTSRTYEVWCRYFNSYIYNVVSQCIHTSSCISYFLPYQHRVVKDMVWQMKYHKHTDALLYSADLIYDRTICTLYDDSMCRSLSPLIDIALIPIPSSSFARSEKNYDHMREVCTLLDTYFSSDSRVSICVDAIKCRVETSHTSQHHGKRKERLMWSKDRFYIDDTFKAFIKLYSHGNTSLSASNARKCNTPKQLYIVCIDDVTTTGATFDAVRGLLNYASDNSLVRVDFIAICH